MTTPNGPAPGDRIHGDRIHGDRTHGDRLPWEEWRRGAPDAFLRTLKLLVTDPGEAFARLRRDGDLVTPLLFGLGVTLLGVVLQIAWGVLFQGALSSATGADPAALVALFGGGAFGIVVGLVLAPFVFLVAVFLITAILHGALLVLGGLEESPMGFEGTLKVVCYASVSHLAGILPLIGGAAALVLALVLQTLGLKAVHRIGAGRAFVAVLVPWLLCCLLAIFSAGALAALFAGLAAGS